MYCTYHKYTHTHTMRTGSLDGIQIYMSSGLSPYLYNVIPNSIWQDKQEGR